MVLEAGQKVWLKPINVEKKYENDIETAIIDKVGREYITLRE